MGVQPRRGRACYLVITPTRLAELGAELRDGGATNAAQLAVPVFVDARDVTTFERQRGQLPQPSPSPQPQPQPQPQLYP